MVHKLKEIAKALYKKVVEWQFHLHFRRVQVYHRGHGCFHYYIQSDGDVKSGTLRVGRWHALAVACVLVLPISLSSFSTESTKLIVEPIDTKGHSVGGIGNLKIDINTGSSETTEEKIAEEEEKVKDLLLGLEVEPLPKKGSKSSAASKKSIQKIDYKVKSGDTLSQIAKRHNVTIDSIVGSAKIENPDRLTVGQVLLIPARDGFFYQVKKNEKLAHILALHKVELEKFLLENPEVNPDLLNPGDQIFLPGAKPIKPVLSWFLPVPSKIITSNYGWRTWPREAFHKGTDLRAVYITVRSAKPGVVKFAGWLGGYGNAIVVAHDGGYKTLYAHLSRIHVKKGQNVGRGQSIGTSGNTGYSFGPHLHFEITRNGKNINPTKIFKGLRHKR